MTNKLFLHVLPKPKPRDGRILNVDHTSYTNPSFPKTQKNQWKISICFTLYLQLIMIKIMKAAKSVLCLNNLFIFQLNLVAFAADVYSRNDFPPGFVFEAATLAYQYEGASNEDGRTPSIWDTFTHAVGNMPGPSPDIACDGYHKYKEDVQLMVDTGLEAYRFSISWSRLIPCRTCY